MSEIRERHNITLPRSIWSILELLKKTQGRSISEILETSVKQLIVNEGYNSTYFKIMATVGEVSDKENKEISSLLDSLNDDDLEIVEKYEI